MKRTVKREQGRPVQELAIELNSITCSECGDTQGWGLLTAETNDTNNPWLEVRCKCGALLQIVVE